jgi:histidine triad (HIT) family protein
MKRKFRVISWIVLAGDGTIGNQTKKPLRSDRILRNMPNSADMTCLFCKIVTQEVSARLVFEDEISIAFLDHRPVFPGHCLLIPRAHHETLGDLPADLVGPFFQNAQLLSRAVESALEAHGTFVAMNNRVSQSVPHFHVHVVPRRRKDGLRGFFWPRQRYQSEAEAEAVQELIAAAIKNQAG